MKKALTFLVATLFTLSAFTQPTKAYMLQVARYNKTIGTWKWDDPDNVNLPITIENNLAKAALIGSLAAAIQISRIGNIPIKKEQMISLIQK